jgi:hypothetical protein
MAAQFPDQVWDARSRTRTASEVAAKADIPPDAWDWNQIVEEVQAVQTRVLARELPAIPEANGVYNLTVTDGVASWTEVVE